MGGFLVLDILEMMGNHGVMWDPRIIGRGLVSILEWWRIRDDVDPPGFWVGRHPAGDGES